MTEKEIERMLKPRFEVIADYPGSNHKVGAILYPPSEMYIEHFKQYPHLFTELKWWEKRSKKDLPKYVSHKGNVYKVDKWNLNEPPAFIALLENGRWCYYDSIQPATEAEYEKGRGNERKSS